LRGIFWHKDCKFSPLGNLECIAIHKRRTTWALLIKSTGTKKLGKLPIGMNEKPANKFKQPKTLPTTLIEILPHRRKE